MPLNSRSSAKPVPVFEIAQRSLFLWDAATKNRNRRRLRPAVRDPSIRSRCSLRQDDRRDAALAFVTLFPCVIQRRCGEESRTSFFTTRHSRDFVPQTPLLNEHRDRSQFAAVGATHHLGSECNVIASSASRRILQKSLFSRKSGRFRYFHVSDVAEREKN